MSCNWGQRPTPTWMCARLYRTEALASTGEWTERLDLEGRFEERWTPPLVLCVTHIGAFQAS